MLIRAEGLEFYLASALLPQRKRPFTWALYGFARYTDEIVDSAAQPVEMRKARLDAWKDAVEAGLRSGESQSPVLHALLHTMERWDIPSSHVHDYLASQEMDLTVRHYPTYGDLRRFIELASMSFGRQMLPVFEPLDAALARQGGDAISEAMQLTNIIRDIRQDFELGRVYLPLEDLDACGVRPQDLAGADVTPQMRAVVARQVARARDLLVTAESQEAALHSTSRRAVRAVHVIYGALLDEVERRGFDVFTSRVRLTPRQKAGTATSALVGQFNLRRANGGCHSDNDRIC
ncbi:phytoene/squalene synthase family protein [Streptomyces sp. DK15]|uniref:phytoene/squalene synthase family protein n=1 Tax=Streptomyces sp. DK15 TaxID=2957499 RepID=UPI0029ACF514|nr:phytoene/squalene synthase family protein [Streptomyces sp. DK15]MDX2395215.1 phytoene/squalene synthase family protein [Streptomyces sp. DK15]